MQQDLSHAVRNTATSKDARVFTRRLASNETELSRGERERAWLQVEGF